MDFMRWRKSISIGLVNNNTDRLHGWAGTTSLITETDAQLIIPLSDKAFLYVSLTPQEPVPMLSLVRRALQVGLWWAGLGRRVVSGWAHRAVHLVGYEQVGMGSVEVQKKGHC